MTASTRQGEGFLSNIEHLGARVAAGATIVTMGTLGLAACTPEVGASPDKTPHASAPATPGGGETSAPTPEAGSGLTVNYDRFADANWQAADEAERMSICREFLGANEAQNKSPEIVLSTHSNGEEAEQWFDGQIEKVYVLYADRSDPRNQDAARKMLECLTVQHESSNSAMYHYGQQLNRIDSFGLSDTSHPVVLTSVTVFSGEAFQATDEFGAPFVALGAQGPASDLAGTPVYHLYELEADPVSGENAMVRAAVVQPASELTQPQEVYFGHNTIAK